MVDGAVGPVEEFLLSSSKGGAGLCFRRKRRLGKSPMPANFVPIRVVPRRRRLEVSTPGSVSHCDRGVQAGRYHVSN